MFGKHRILTFTVMALLLLQLSSCLFTRDNVNTVYTDSVGTETKIDDVTTTETSHEVNIDDVTATETSHEDNIGDLPTDKIEYDKTVLENKYCKIVESSEHFMYAYFIYGEGGNVVRTEEGLIHAPAVSVNEDEIVSILFSEGTGMFGQWAYYYDYKADTFSDRINSVFCEYEGIVAALGEDRIIVRDIFDKNVFYKEIFTSEFKEPLSDAMEAIIEVSFVENGTKLKVIYLTGTIDGGEEALEIFDLEETDEILPTYSIEICDYINRERISDQGLTEDQKTALDTLCVALDDILKNGPTKEKIYFFEKPVKWLDYRTALNVFNANYTAAEDIISWFFTERNEGSPDQVEGIYYYMYDERHEKLFNEFIQTYNDQTLEAERILSSLVYDGTEYGKAWSIAKWLIDNVEYDHYYDDITSEAYSTYSAIIKKKTVCAGYAKGYDFLCKKAGLDVIYVTGFSGEMLHAWNMIRIGGEWYHIDVTWMDSIMNSPYKNFMMSDSICQANGHSNWEYYRHHESNTPVCPIASSLELYKYEGMVTSVDSLNEALLSKKPHDGKMLEVIAIDVPVEDIMELHGTKITSNEDGNEYYVRIFSVDLDDYAENSTFSKVLKCSIYLESKWSYTYEPIIN